MYNNSSAYRSSSRRIATAETPTTMPMEQLPRRRRRPALSCLECRRRKIKCDRTEPCKHCTAAKTHCTYKFYSNEPLAQRQPLQPQQGGSPRPTSSPSVYAPSSSGEAQHTDTQKPPIATNANNSSTPQCMPALRTEEVCLNNIEGHERQIDRNQGSAGDFRDILLRAERLKELSASGHMRGLSEAARDIILRQHGLQDSEVILNKTRILRWSHWVGAAPEFTLLIASYTEALDHCKGMSPGNNRATTLMIQIGDLFRKCKHVARTIKLGRPSRCLTAPDFDLTPPSREVGDTMTTLYLRSFESVFRTMHIPTFWKEYQGFWDNPEGTKIGVRLKVLLVIAIGSSLSKHGDVDESLRNMAHQWIYAAQKWLSGPLEKDRLDVTGIQVQCLLILARQVFSIGGDLVWVSTGSLIHAAMQIGLHRDPKHLPKMSVLQAEVRRRLWSTILELVIQASLDSAMPPRISLDEYDTEAPSNINDDEIDESNESVKPCARNIFTATSLQLLLHDSASTRLRILQLLNGLHSELSYVEVLALSSQITEVYQSCNGFMKEKEAAGVTAFQRNLIDYMVRRLMVPLHCPFATKARKSPLFNYSLKISLDTAMSIISPEPDDGFSRIMALGGGMFREAIRYACSIISLELIAQVEAQRLDGTLRRNTQYIDILKKMVNDIMVLSIERIRQGETNIKTPVFVNMILGQVEAMEAGTSLEPRIAQCAKDSLELCHEMLLTQAAKIPSAFSQGNNFTPTSLEGDQDGYSFDLDLDFFLSDAGFS